MDRRPLARISYGRCVHLRRGDRQLDGEEHLKPAAGGGPCAFECVALGRKYRAPGSVVTALQDITFSCGANEFLCIVGPSGCGKTTLLKLLAGLIEPSSGQIRFPSPSLNSKRRTALVFQDHALFPWMSVLDNVAFCLEASGVGRRLRRQRSRQLLSALGLAPFADLLPGRLSAGMRQRAGIARALLANPPILLMDEPFGALDAQTRRFLQRELLRYWESRRNAVVFVTHDVEEAVLLADRVVVLTGRPGKIIADLPVPLPRPRALTDTELSEAIALKHRIWAMIEGQVASSLEVPP